MPSTMTSSTPTRDTQRSGVVSIVFGFLALVGLGWTWVLSASDVLDPPNWVRIPGILLLPVALLVAAAAGLQARQGTGRQLGVVGLLLAALAIAGFVVLLTIAG